MTVVLLVCQCDTSSAQVNNECLDVLSRMATSLCSLDVTGCTQVSDDGLLCLSRLSALSQLHAEKCWRIRDVQWLSDSVDTLSLVGCDSITCSHPSWTSHFSLRALDLSGCTALIESGLYRLCGNARGVAGVGQRNAASRTRIDDVPALEPAR